MSEQTAEGVARFDLSAHIDEQPITWRNWVLLGVCTLILFMDAFDIFMVGKIAPAIARGLGRTPQDMTELFLIQQSGLAIGAFLIPPIADRIGRKPTLFVGSIVFGITSLMGTQVTTLEQLAWLRGAGGIAMSAMLPVGLALLSEMTPKRRRGFFISLALVGFSGGSAASGGIAAWLLDDYGWRVGFLIGGIGPLIIAPLILLLPESLPFRATRNPRDQRIADALRRLDPAIALPPEAIFRLGNAKPPSKAGPFAMFNKDWWLTTVLFWAAGFMAVGNVAVLASWMATYFQELGGVPIQQFAVYAMIAFGGGACGTLLAGWLLDRMNGPLLIMIYFFVDAVALVMVGILPFGTTGFLCALILWNVAQIGGQSAFNTFITLSYPVEMRTSGFGWAGGAGRIGGIILPGIGGLALGWGQPLSVVMAMTAIPPLIIVLIMGTLGLVQRRQRMRLAATGPEALPA